MSTISPRAPHTLKTRRANASTQDAGEPLGRYTDPRGRERELVWASGAGASTLVLDRLARTLTDARLVAHLAADEPLENAQIVASLYLADVHGRHCRRLTRQDFDAAPFAARETQPAIAPESETGASEAQLVDRHARVCRLQLAPNGRSVTELRWNRHPSSSERGCPELVTVREVIGAMENYEPARALTAKALEAYEDDPNVSVTALRAEFQRMLASRIVLNRGLREAVLAAVENGGLSLSEIAMRCGRLKRDAHGSESGETSWLARRIGTLPEGGQHAPTPWVSSDVLALIARRGLGLAPREVELG